MTNVPPPPKDPYEKIRVYEVEKDREKESFEKLPAKGFPLIWSKFISILKKALSVFGESQTKQAVLVFKQIAQNLTNLRSLLNQLKQTDLSQEAEYLQELSCCWNNLLKRYQKTRHKKELYSHLHDFISLLQEFPEQGEYSFGYYLSEYAGEKWIPFPFMEIVSKIHHQHKNYTENSVLTLWTEKIATILQIIKRQTTEE